MRAIVTRDPGPVLWLIILVALVVATAWNFAQGGERPGKRVSAQASPCAVIAEVAATEFINHG
jgi:hypothetical protein